MRRVLKVVKNPSFNGNVPMGERRKAMTVHLDDGTSRDLMVEAFGKQNWEETTHVAAANNDLILLDPSDSKGKIILWGSPLAMKLLA